MVKMMSENIKVKVLEIFKWLGTIFIYFLVTILASVITSYYTKSNNFWISNLSLILSVLIVSLTLAFLYRKTLINDLKNFKKEYLFLAFKYWLIGFLFMLITNYSLMFFLKDMPTNESANRVLISTYPLYSIISMCFLAPFNEEITFRLSLKKVFKNKYVLATVSALIFGYLHVFGSSFLEMLYIIPYGSLGFAFALLMYETDNIYPSILMHTLHNILSIIVILIGGGL